MIDIDDQVRDSVLNNIAAQVWKDIHNQIMSQLCCHIAVDLQARHNHTQLLQHVCGQVRDHEH